MRFVALASLFIAAVCINGCVGDSEVTRDDVEKNKKEFSQENYEKAMIAAGKGKELEEEKKRNAAHEAGQ